MKRHEVRDVDVERGFMESREVDVELYPSAELSSPQMKRVRIKGGWSSSLWNAGEDERVVTR